MTKQRQYQAFMSLVMLFVLFQSMGLLAMTDFFLSEFSLTDAESWGVLSLCLLMAASYFLLFHKVATAHLTFESDDRSSGIRLVCSGQFFLLWIGLFVLSWLGSSTFRLTDDILISAVVLSFLHWAVVGLVAVTEDPYLSRRIRRNLPAGPMRRLLWAPFLQGGHRGFLYVLIHVGLLVAASLGAILLQGSSADLGPDVILSLASYVLIYLGMACVLGRWCFGLSGDLRPSHVRALTLIIVGIGAISPFIPLLWRRDYSSRFHWSKLPNPVVTVDHLADGSQDAPVIVTVLGLLAILAVLANLRAMRQGIAEVMFADAKRPESSDGSRE